MELKIPGNGIEGCRMPCFTLRTKHRLHSYKKVRSDGLNRYFIGPPSRCHLADRVSAVDAKLARNVPPQAIPLRDNRTGSERLVNPCGRSKADHVYPNSGHTILCATGRNSLMSSQKAE